LAASSDTRSDSATHGFRVLPVTAEPSSCPFFPPKQDFRDEVAFRRRCASPEGYGISFRLFRAEALPFLKPCDSVAKRTFPIFGDLLNIRDRGPFVQTSALLMRRPGGLTESDPVSVKFQVTFRTQLALQPASSA
jgi:hypothetical protein